MAESDMFDGDERGSLGSDAGSKHDVDSDAGGDVKCNGDGGSIDDLSKLYGFRSQKKIIPAQKAKIIKLNSTLDKWLHEMGAYECSEETEYRLDVLRRLESLISEWLSEVGRSSSTNSTGTPEPPVEYRLLTFGSCGMEVQCQGTDVDLLVLAPHFIPRKEFFSSFVLLLQQQPETRCLRAIPESYVPVIKLEFCNIQLDILFANVNATIYFPTDIAILKDLTIIPSDDIKSLRSLNGFRISEEIVELAPNVDAFRFALRAIKLWAKAKGIYSNILGFLGGVSYSILVARTCQQYPEDSGAVLVFKLFQLFANWDWSKPVMLKDVYCTDAIARGDVSHWNPQGNERDRCQLMPIITPCLPPINSAYNVTKSSFVVMVDELQDAAILSSEIMSGKKAWLSLFERENFYRKYNHFSIVTVRSYEDVELHAEWTGLVESKLRFLVCMLEECREISIAHINPTPYSTLTQPFITRWTIGLSLVDNDTSLNLMTVGHQFKSIVLGHLHRFNMTTRFERRCYDIEVEFCDGFVLHNYLPLSVIQTNPAIYSHRCDTKEPQWRRRQSSPYSGYLPANSEGGEPMRNGESKHYYPYHTNGALNSDGGGGGDTRRSHETPGNSDSYGGGMQSVRSWPDIASHPNHDGYYPGSYYGPSQYRPHPPNGYSHCMHDSSLLESLHLLGGVGGDKSPRPDSYSSAPPNLPLHHIYNITDALDSLCLDQLEPYTSPSKGAAAGAYSNRKFDPCHFPTPPPHIRPQTNNFGHPGGHPAYYHGRNSTGHRRRHGSSQHRPHSNYHPDNLALPKRYENRSVPELRSPPQSNMQNVYPVPHRNNIKISLKSNMLPRKPSSNRRGGARSGASSSSSLSPGSGTEDWNSEVGS